MTRPHQAAQVAVTSHAAYRRLLDERLAQRPLNGLTCIDGWAGAGGLSLGFERAGFTVTGYEQNPHAVATYNHNLHGECIQATITEDTDFPQADLFIGGPPCQPFSVVGRQDGKTDSRDGFPSFIAAVRRTQPKAWMFENVYNLVGKHGEYLDSILAELEGLGYHTQVHAIRADHFGVPQKRRRAVVIGTKQEMTVPAPSGPMVPVRHALGSLATRELSPRRHLTPAQDEYIARYEAKSKCRVPRDLHLDQPARTLTCRNLAGSTSDMQRLRLPDGQRRRLSTAEAARLQSFPIGYRFMGPEGSQFTQIGNAVPPLVAKHFADALASHLLQCQMPGNH